jgi:hypothetical protein
MRGLILDFLGLFQGFEGYLWRVCRLIGWEMGRGIVRSELILWVGRIS